MLTRSRWFEVVRRGIEAVEGVLFAGGWAARAAHAAGLQGQVDVVRFDVAIGSGVALPRELRIAFLSDLHVGPLTDPRTIEAALRIVSHEAPDLVLLGGDFIGLSARQAGELERVAGRLQAPFGVVAVLGNHDRWHGDAAVRAALGRAGVAVLCNGSLRLAPPFDGVVIGGLDDPATGAPDAAAAFRDEQGLRIALMHSPEGVPLLEGHGVALAFAGHTHGGQVCLPGGRPLLVPAGCGRWPGGRFAVPGIPGGLIVSRGVGCTLLPLRTACPAEVVISRLTTDRR